MGIMYDDLAKWWPVLSPVADYAEEAGFFGKLIDDFGLPANASMIEFGAGGGNNASYFKSRFNEVLLTDLSADMLAISAQLNPECAHAVGDMRTFDAAATFDVVFIHDAIDYMTTLDDLNVVFRNVYKHCKTDGLVMLVPDCTRETYEASTDHGGSDSEERSLRFLEWSYDPDPEDTHTVVEYVFAFREGDGPVRSEHETHHCGLFSREQWIAGLSGAGFVVTTVIDSYEREVFLGRRY